MQAPKKIKKDPNAIPFCIMAYGKARVPAPTVAAIRESTEPVWPPGLSLNEAYLTGALIYIKGLVSTISFDMK